MYSVDWREFFLITRTGYSFAESGSHRLSAREINWKSGKLIERDRRDVYIYSPAFLTFRRNAHRVCVCVVKAMKFSERVRRKENSSCYFPAWQYTYIATHHAAHALPIRLISEGCCCCLLVETLFRLLEREREKGQDHACMHASRRRRRQEPQGRGATLFLRAAECKAAHSLELWVNATSCAGHGPLTLVVIVLFFSLSLSSCICCIYSVASFADDAVTEISHRILSRLSFKLLLIQCYIASTVYLSRASKPRSCSSYFLFFYVICSLEWYTPHKGFFDVNTRVFELLSLSLSRVSERWKLSRIFYDSPRCTPNCVCVYVYVSQTTFHFA